MKLLTVITLMVLASTASGISCYKGENTDDYGEGPHKTDCDGVAEEERSYCYQAKGYEDGKYYERWGCGTGSNADGKRREEYSTEICDYNYCNGRAGDDEDDQDDHDDEDSWAAQLAMSTLSVFVPAALLYYY